MAPGAIMALVVALLCVAQAGHRWYRATLRPRHLTPLLAALTGSVLLYWVTGTSWATSSMTNLVQHMISHVVVMFLVPIAFVYSGVARGWWTLVPVAQRRRLLRWWYVSRPRLPQWCGSPALAVVAFNGAMVLAHVPAVFNYCMAHEWAMQWLMDMGFLVTGLWFFHFLVPSTPRRVRTSLRWQVLLVASTVFEMLILAMSMSIFTHVAWYEAGAVAMGMTNTQGFDLHHQQLAAGVLWICGDLWAVPLAVVIVRRVIQKEGSLFGLLDRQLSVGGVTGG